MNRIAVLTSGGDAPGMNACVRAVVRTALNFGLDVYGIERGYQGLIDGDVYQLNTKSVSDIIQRGGTFLRSARCPEFVDVKYQQKAAEVLNAYGIEGLIVIGGDGTFRGAQALSKNFGINVIGIPGTIDNDLGYTDFTLGFDTAVNTVLWAINSLRDTMHAHDRVSVLQVMGRHCGDIALYSAITGGAEYVLVPEVPYDIEEIAKSLKKTKVKGKTSNMIVFAEGAGDSKEFMDKLQELTDMDIKYTSLGHIQRGGSPSMRDRLLAVKWGIHAVELLRDGKDCIATGIKGDSIVDVPFEDVFNVKKVFDIELYNKLKLLTY